MIKLLQFILFMIFFVSCGDLFTSKVDDEKERYTQFAVCDLDVDSFSYILEKDISSDIECLRENLGLFIDTVKTDRPGFVSKKILKEFILTGPMDVDADTADMVDSVFDISHLILGTDRDYIEQKDVNILLDFLRFFNGHIWQSYRYFNDNSDVNYQRHVKERNIVYNEFSLIAHELKRIYKGERDYVDRIDIEKLVFNFFKSKVDTLEKIRSVMFLKRVFLGGEIWDLTHVELAHFLDSAPQLIQVAFDIVKVENYEFEDEQQTLLKIFLRDIEIINKFLYYDASSHQAVFNVYDLINVLTTMAPSLLPFDISKYPREVMKLKEIFLGNGSEIFAAKEIISALEQGKYLLEEADLFYRVYDFYREDMESRLPITHDFSDFPVRTSLEQSFLKHFARIASDYKFIKGTATSPYYTFDYFRNENSFFQTSALEYVMEKAMAYYGRSNEDARGGYDMTLDQTVNMVRDFKWFLRDNGIINIGRKGGGEIEGVADNLVLMSTLFQYQSDGCSTDFVCMEVPEVTEFVMGLLTAVEVKGFFTDKMVDLCSDSLDEYDRISPECFRRNFINVIETPIPGDGKSIADYMPFMYQYLKDLVKDVPEGEPITSSVGFMKFITETESFTRSCMYYDKEKTDEVYLKVNDAFAVFAGLLNVESTLLRFDLDKNNVVDARNINGKNEVLNAFYKTYKGALIALVVDKVGGQEWIAKLIAKPIFQYLVKYGEVPNTDKFKSVWRFLRFILRKNKNADITRTTVSTILKTIGEQSENADLHPYKCDECFRNPTFQCIPEGDDWI